MNESLSLGASGEEVKKLQQQLLNAGYDLGDAGADGDFGSLTQSALQQYQRDKGLAADGVYGPETQKSLLGESAAPGYDASQNHAYQQAQQQLEAHRQQAPSYTDAYAGELDSLYQQILNRPAFAYDPMADALYGQYRDQYLQSGSRAQADRMAQAAALTGGYLSSYALSQGQQQYSEALRGLNEQLPALYDRAFRQYEAEGESLQGRYAAAQSARSADYARYQDSLAAWQQERDALADAAAEAYDRGYESWQAGVKNSAEAHERLRELISSSGYRPSANELQKAGMSRAEAEGYLRLWQQQDPEQAWRAGTLTAEDYYILTGKRKGKSSGSAAYASGGKKQEEPQGPEAYELIRQRAQIERDYNDRVIDYDDRERLVNALYGWR